MIPKKIYITWETKELPHENMKNAFGLEDLNMVCVCLF